MLRVISGSARKLLLKTPEGLDTRPTTDRIKETLFNMLQLDIPGAVCIDFFAGSGSIGIEALSRGAKKCYFADNGKEAYKCIVENVKHTHLEDKAVIFNQDSLRASMQVNESHVDLIFMDAPYGQGLEADLMSNLKNMKYVDEETLFIVEESLDFDSETLTSLGYSLEKEKKYKTNKHLFLRLAGE